MPLSIGEEAETAQMDAAAVTAAGPIILLNETENFCIGLCYISCNNMAICGSLCAYGLPRNKRLSSVWCQSELSHTIILGKTKCHDH